MSYIDNDLCAVLSRELPGWTVMSHDGFIAVAEHPASDVMLVGIYRRGWRCACGNGGQAVADTVRCPCGATVPHKYEERTASFTRKELVADLEGTLVRIVEDLKKERSS